MHTGDGHSAALGDRYSCVSLRAGYILPIHLASVTQELGATHQLQPT